MQDRRGARPHVVDRAGEGRLLSTCLGRATDQESLRRRRIGPARPVRAHSQEVGGRAPRHGGGDRRRASGDADRSLEPFLGVVQGDEGREVPSRRLTPDPDGVRVDPYARTEPTQPANGGLDVVKAGGKVGLAAEAILHEGHGDAPAEQGPTYRLGVRAVQSRTEEPGTTVDPDHHRDGAGRRWGKHEIHPERPVPHDPRVLDVGVAGAAGRRVRHRRRYLVARGIRTRRPGSLRQLHAWQRIRSSPVPDPRSCGQDTRIAGYRASWTMRPLGCDQAAHDGRLNPAKSSWRRGRFLAA